MGILVSFATLVRMVALGFAFGIIVGLYFGISGSTGSDSGTCRPDIEQCAPATTPPATPVNPEVAP